VQGHKFAVGALDREHPTDGDDDYAPLRILGVVIAGRPTAREFDDGWTIEVTRLCTDGARNVGSFLYGAANRAAFALGYVRVVTYTLASESGASLRAAGYRVIAERAARPSWDTPSRPRPAQYLSTNRLLWGVEEQHERRVERVR